MSRKIETCEFDEIIYTRLVVSEDILQAIWDIAKEHDIRAGVVLEGTGALQNIRFQRFPLNNATCRLPMDVWELKGPIQTNVRGIVGVTAEPDADWPGFEGESVPGVTDDETARWQFSGSEGGVGTPYFHGHFSAINKDVSTMGGLLPGALVENPGMGARGRSTPTHYTLVIGKLKGVEFQMKMGKNGVYHDVVKI